MPDYETESHRSLSFRLEGTADITDPDRFDYQDVIVTSVATLSDNADQIADEIAQSLREYLPPAVGVLVELRFYEGSITWFGVAEVLDWVGRIVDVVGFVQIAVKVIQFASNKAIRRTARAADIPLATNTMRTTIIPNFPPQASPDIQARGLIARQDEQIRLLRDLLQSQTGLMRYFGQLQRNNPMFRPQFDPKQFRESPSSSNLKDVLIVLILITLTVLQVIILFGLRI